MKKTEAIRIITDCAQIYHKELENRNLLFLFSTASKPECFEAEFSRKNFLHLTGVLPENINSTGFFEKCLDRQLRLNEFEFAANGTTELKLQILPQLVQIQSNAKMIGEYDSSRIMLHTDKLAGNVTACMGFIHENQRKGFYIPNTALKEDIRKINEYWLYYGKCGKNSYIPSYAIA